LRPPEAAPQPESATVPATVIPSCGRLLAIDPGSKRIGVAVSDPGRILAQPLTTLVRRSDRRDAEAIQALATQHEVVAIVVGLPINMDGSRGSACAAAEALLERLRAACGMPVVGWDERLTSAQAERLLVSAGVRREERRQGATDRIAAALILESFLGACAAAGGPPRA
jgi:putative Holliday junction resolvase